MNQDLGKPNSFLSRLDEEKGFTHHLDNRLVTLTAPSSVAAEQYRSLYYHLENLRLSKPMQVVAFTSPIPKDGKTMTAINLAMASARASPERKILLVDADVRRNEVARFLNMRARPGLVELIEGQAELQESLRRFRSTNLSILTSGTAHPEPTPLLASSSFNQLVSLLKTAFDEVYIDLPPALLFSDAAIVSRKADGVVLIVRAFQTKRHQVDETVERLKGAPLLGCVLNGVDNVSESHLRNYFR